MELFEIRVGCKPVMYVCGIDELDVRDHYEPLFGNEIEIKSLGPAPDEMWCEVAA